MTTQFTVNATQYTVDFSEKAKAEGVKGFYISARRWFQKTYGNTYHSVKVYAVMADDSLGDVVAENSYAYGYGDHYLVTACEALIKAGYINTENEYALSGRQVQQALKIEHNATDVQCKKDL